MTVHVILGDQPKPDDTLSHGHQVRLDAALARVQSGDCIITTGGVTVPNAASEAALATAYLRAEAPLAEVVFELEDNSRTTAQNFRFTKEILRRYPGHNVVVYCGRAQLPKAKVLRWWLWPHYDVTFITLPDHRGLAYQLPQLIVGTLLSLLDPYEVWIGKLALKRQVRQHVLE